MTRIDAIASIFAELEQSIVVTIMGAVAAEMQSIGHRPNFFYLQHAMGLASSLGLGIALSYLVVHGVLFLLFNKMCLYNYFQFFHFFHRNSRWHFAFFYFAYYQLRYFLCIGFGFKSFIAGQSGRTALVDH